MNLAIQLVIPNSKTCIIENIFYIYTHSQFSLDSTIFQASILNRLRFIIDHWHTDMALSKIRGQLNMLNMNSLFKTGPLGTLFPWLLNQSQNGPLRNVITRHLGQRLVATLLLSLILICVFAGTSQTLYAASLTVNTVILSDDSVADSDYLLNFSTFTTDHSVRYCIDTFISSDFYLTFTLSNGAVWENALFSASLSIEGSTVTHAIIEGGSSGENFVKFLIHGSKESISSGTCFVIGKSTDIVMRIPKGTPSDTQFQIQVETQLANEPSMIIEPSETADWVAIQPDIDCETVTAIPQNECDTLVEIYNATNGPDWTDRATNNWNMTNIPCTWTGITCTDEHVTRITRKLQNLVGTLPKLSAFTKLQIFDLANNQLSGSIASDLNTLTQLQEFNLWGNELTGPIPDLSTLTQLQKLKLGGGNQLSGPIPDLSTLSNLVELDLSNNQLTDNLPELSTLTQLEILNLGNNQLTGSIPDLSALAQLEILHLQNNKLSGTIPDLKNLTQLQELYLQNNQLSGNIPASLVQLTQLQDQEGLYLSYNALTATDSALLSFLKNKNPDWAETQTIAPFVIEPIVLSDTEIQIRWASIIYQANGGYYQVKYTTESSDEYIIEKTADKKATGHVVKNLLPNTTYIFVVETYTPAHSQQQNALTSTPSKEIKATTTQQLGPVYISTPQPNTLLDMGNSELGIPSSTTAIIIINKGDKPLEVSESRISGTQANDFRIKSFAAPFSLSDSNTEQTLVLECIPSQIGVRTAILTLKTNDPEQSTVSYPLTCRTPGQETGKPTYDSVPEPNNILMMGSNELGNPISSHITVLEIGTATLDVTASSLTGPHASDFSIVAGNAPFSIPDNDAPHTLFLHCLPSEIGERTADLTLTTNDPDLITVKYRLKCEAIGPIYDSQPLPGSTLTLSGDDSTLSTVLTVSNRGNDTLEVLESQISGNDESDFSISRGAPPFSIPQGGEPHTLNIQCFSNQSDERTATLTLTTTDQNQITVTYPLSCFGKGVGPVYASEPEPNSTLILGTAVVNTAITTELLISEAGDETLEVSDAQISGQHQNDFSLLFENERVSENDQFSIPDGDSSLTLTMKCTPREKGERTATLTLTTNDPNQSTVTYPLSCSGTSVGPVYASEPEPNTPLTIGAAVVNTAITTELLISEAGDETLEVSDAQISGQHQDDFSLLSFNETVSGNEPFSIPDGGSTQTLTVRCTPSDIGDRSATLSFSTNDPNQSTVTYPLNCSGTSIGPVYASEPEPNTPLSIGAAVVNTAITTELLISEAGDETLEISEAQISGQHQDDFSLLSFNETVSENDLLSIPDGAESQTLTVRCTPSDIGDRSATLSFSTNDPNQAQVSYPLTCQGSVDEARFTGEIRTQFQAVGNNMTIDSPEKIKLIGRIQPAKQHIGQRANLFFRYQWTPQNGGTPLNIEVTLAEQQPLEEQIEITLFEGWLIGLTGVFKIDLGYQLPNDELLFDEIATLTVRPNTEPTDIILEGNTVQENSPSNTQIGTFSTFDADKGDRFVYGLIENPNKYFKIKGNELRVSKRLDFETASEYPITVRSVDSNGSYQDKSFIIRVTEAQANPVDIHLTEESVLENMPSNTIIGRFWTEDAEQGNYDYELLDGAEGYFMLDAVENDILRLAPGKSLDFETQEDHQIRVRSTERQLGSDIEKTFTIKLINVADVIVQAEIRDILTDSLIERPINATESVKFNVQLIPDKAHHGQEAEIICMALHLVNEETETIYVLEGEHWQEWDQNIALPAVMSITLQENHNLALWQGVFTQKVGQLNLYVGYRLETGELVYSPEGFEIIFEE